MDLVLGIDVAEARKGLDVVAMDTDRQVAEVRRKATAADVRSMTDALDPAVVCIDSPPAWARSGKSRTAELALRPIGVSAYSTPMDPGDHPFYRWMRAGFAVFDAVAERYPRYLGGAVHGTAAEVFPEATAVLLAGHLRAKDDPKPAFRRRVLDAHRVDHSTLRSVDAVDAALAALTGVLALEGECTAIGDPTEGVILLPVRTLPAARLERRASTIAPRPAASLDGVCLDCGPDQFAAMVRFYARLLGRSVAAGCTDPATCTHEGDHWAHLPDPRGGATINVQSETWYEPPVWPERPGRPSKMAHLELAVTDVDKAVEVAVGAGATEAVPQPGDRDPDQLRVMLDPAGHPFCLCRD